MAAAVALALFVTRIPGRLSQLLCLGFQQFIGSSSTLLRTSSLRSLLITASFSYTILPDMICCPLLKEPWEPYLFFLRDLLYSIFTRYPCSFGRSMSAAILPGQGTKVSFFPVRVFAIHPSKLCLYVKSLCHKTQRHSFSILL